ncbi:response regulator [Atopomonas sediminilitoris]|uniref:response regulator n=1 Tax=Atopomonas sediminilitoris TaxID=2919919 RepID=UPI001F4F0125|nr:response regulator transcription factor [Atopomonas sediminilitoris]MCJ8168915.1 response regulator transcription factor [Atopomonas sediminilitoris]
MTSVHTALPAELSLLLVDDHRIYLDGLAFALRELTANTLIDTVTSAQQAREKLAQHDYDLVLLDVNLPDESGLSLLRSLQAQSIASPVAMLSASDSGLDMQQALKAGALGFISKSADGAVLREQITRLLLGESLPTPKPLPASNGPTPRQLEILQLLAEGMPNKLISRQLNISEDTIKTHLKALFQLLDVHNRTACVNAARDRGWL